MATEKLQTYPQKTRVFILSDISNEPDDAESLCRYLLYTNQFETEGLVACTSTWMKNKVCPQDMEKIIDAYAGAVENLNKHVHPKWQYPAADHLKGLIRKGAETYGMSAVHVQTGGVPASPGAELLYDRIVAPSTQPLWILCWGGTNTLAQALLMIDHNYSADDARRLLSRIRVYAISDQDDSGAWIRNNFPDVFYIASIHGWNQYGLAAWTGISGDKYYGFDQGGPDFTKMEKSWIKENIQIGPLGSAYPDYLFIPEGDTPTFLYLIQNGLGVPDCPSYGSWGGRYALTDISNENGAHYSDAVDRVKVNDKTYTSNHATIWRWRDAFQDDFAARIKWTMEPDFAKANHHPVIIVNDAIGIAPVRIDAEAGSKVTLDATRTYDPDGRTLTYKWWHYREPTATQWWVDAEVAELAIHKLDSEGRKVEVTLPPPEKCAVELMSRKPVAMGQLLHLILEVTDDGTPSLTSYRRVLIQVTNKELRGGSHGADAIGDVMKDLNPNAFRKIQAETGALIGGDFARKFVANQAPQTVRTLHVYIAESGDPSKNHLDIIDRYLKSDGWTSTSVKQFSSCYKKKHVIGGDLSIVLAYPHPAPIHQLLEDAETTASLNIIAWNKAYILFPRSSFIDKECYMLRNVFCATTGESLQEHVRELSTSGPKIRVKNWDQIQPNEITRLRRIGDQRTWMIGLDVSRIDPPTHPIPDTVVESSMFRITECLDFLQQPDELLCMRYNLKVHPWFNHSSLRYAYIGPEGDQIGEMNHLKLELDNMSLFELAKLPTNQRPVEYDQIIAARVAGRWGNGRTRVRLTFPGGKVPDCWTYYDDELIEQLRKIWRNYDEEETDRRKVGSIGSHSRDRNSE